MGAFLLENQMLTGITEIAAIEVDGKFHATIYTKIDNEPVFVRTDITSDSRAMTIMKGKEWWKSLNDPEAMVLALKKEQAPR